MLKVGLTGGIGSGKSTVAQCFQTYGVPIIDADRISRGITSHGSPFVAKIAEHFGDHILYEDGSLNRKKLREVIFNDHQAKKWLEALLHPAIRLQIVEGLDNAAGPYVILESPLLFETKQNLLVQQCIVVDLPVELQIKRAAARDANTEAQIKSIMQTQWSREQRLNAADFVIDNSHSLQNTHQQIEQLHFKLLELAQHQT